MHHRVRPFRHRFTYRVFSLLLDVDELPLLARTLRLFSYNRFNVLSLKDSDLGPRDGTKPRHWVEHTLEKQGYGFPVGSIQVLCFPRLFGYVFNPLSVYYVHDVNGALRVMLYEVTNTYKDRHTYVLPVEGNDPIVRQACDKNLYVSPFIGMEARYHFRLRAPDDALAVAIREEQPDGNVLYAAMTGYKLPLTDGMLARMVLTHPLMTLKITAGIHWQALRLWRKGATVFAHGTPPANAVSGRRGDLNQNSGARVAAE